MPPGERAEGKERKVECTGLEGGAVGGEKSHTGATAASICSTYPGSHLVLSDIPYTRNPENRIKPRKFNEKLIKG